MTELEKHLLAGFEKLSKQYSAEQLHSAGQVRVLSLQVVQLSQRVEQLTRLHHESQAQRDQELTRVFGTLSAQLKELSES